MGQFNAKGFILGMLMLPLLAACNDMSQSQIPSNPSNPLTEGVANMLTVYKSPSCGCCTKWLSHVNAEGLETSTKHPANLDEIKDHFNISTNLRSCHTAVSTQGFVFEGHIPARYIQQFLANPPAGGVGLAVPAMPLGSPGMEVGNKFMPYDIVLLNSDGSTQVYASIKTAAQQFQQSEQPD